MREVHLLSLAEIAAKPLPRWRIYKLVSGLTVLWGLPGSFKTFLAVAWSVCVASGRAWMGRKVQQGAVIYVVGEGNLRAFHNRVTVAAKKLGIRPSKIPNLPIYVTESALDLSKWSGTDAQELRKEAERLAKEHGPIGLLVVDTASRCLASEDENNQSVMSAFVETLDNLCRELGCDVVVIHHAGADGKRERGSSVLRGAADAMLRVKSDKVNKRGHRNISLFLQKLKEGEIGADGAPVASMVAVQAAVTGDDGKPLFDEEDEQVTTCYLTEGQAQKLEDDSMEILRQIPVDGISGNNLAAALHRQKGPLNKDLDRLAAEGFVCTTGSGPTSKWKLSAKGQAIIGSEGLLSNPPTDRTSNPEITGAEPVEPIASRVSFASKDFADSEDYDPGTVH